MSDCPAPPDLPAIARTIRRDIIELAHRSKSPHVGSALSCVDILIALYFDRLRLDPWPERDIFIMSKAHAAMALYSTLAARGIMSRELLAGYYVDDGTLPAHLERFSAPGIEASTGSLGHGFSMGLGMAYGFKKKAVARQVFTLIGDGESQEGSVWEGALFAPRLGLDNFTAIMDRNDLQGYGRPNEICAFESVREKWQAFGWQVFLSRALRQPAVGKPRMIIARTIKGKGVSFMEDALIWHYYVVTAAHKEKALRVLQ